MRESKRTLLTVGFLLGIIPFICCEGSMVSSILQESKDAVNTFDVEKNMEVVKKYYFTTTKEKSIWYHLLKEERERFGLQLSFDNLKFYEQLLQKLASHYNMCLGYSALSRTRCLLKIHSFLEDLEIGFRWDDVPGERVDQRRIQFGILYNGAGALTAHLAIIAVKLLDKHKERGLLRHKAKPFIDVLHRFDIIPLFDAMNWDKSVVAWRVDQISPATICNVKEHFWKEFEQNCETRWHSTEEYDNVKKRGKISIESENNTTSTEGHDPKDEFDSFVNDYVNVEDTTLNIVDELGGVDNYIHKRFRAQVTDKVTNEVIFEKYMNAAPASRGEVMHKLAMEALEARTKVLPKLIEETSKVVKKWYMRDSITKVMRFLSKF